MYFYNFFIMLVMYMDFIFLKQYFIICWYCRRLGLVYWCRDFSLQVNGVQNFWFLVVLLILYRLRVMRVFIIGLMLVLFWVVCGWVGLVGVVLVGVGFWGFIMFMKVIIFNILLFLVLFKRVRFIGFMLLDIFELVLLCSFLLSIVNVIGLFI